MDIRNFFSLNPRDAGNPLRRHGVGGQTSHKGGMSGMTPSPSMRKNDAMVIEKENLEKEAPIRSISPGGKGAQSKNLATEKKGGNESNKKQKESEMKNQILEKFRSYGIYACFQEDSEVIEQARAHVDQQATYRMFVDGACLPNPGKGGCGYVIYNPTGEELLINALFLGDCTNNIAEYAALVYGMKTALDLEIKKIEIFSDSRLIADQMNGLEKVSDKVLKLFNTEGIKLRKQFENVKIEWTPRENNQRADELANWGLSVDQRGQAEGERKVRQKEKNSSYLNSLSNIETRGRATVDFTEKDLELVDKMLENERRNERMTTRTNLELPGSQVTRSLVEYERVSEEVAESETKVMDVTFGCAEAEVTWACQSEARKTDGAKVMGDLNCANLENTFSERIGMFEGLVKESFIDCWDFCNKWRNEHEDKINYLKQCSDQITEQIQGIELCTANWISYGEKILEPWRMDVNNTLDSMMTNANILVARFENAVNGCMELESRTDYLLNEINALRGDNQAMRSEIIEMRRVVATLENRENRRVASGIAEDGILQKAEQTSLNLFRILQDEIRGVQYQLKQELDMIVLARQMSNIKIQDENTKQVSEKNIGTDDHKLLPEEDKLEAIKPEECVSVTRMEILAEKDDTSERRICIQNQDSARKLKVKCKFGDKCWNVNCRWFHPETTKEEKLKERRARDGNDLNRDDRSTGSPHWRRQMCRYDRACLNPDCRYSHSSPLCRFGNKCINQRCWRRHLASGRNEEVTKIYVKKVDMKDNVEKEAESDIRNQGRTDSADLRKAGEDRRPNSPRRA